MSENVEFPAGLIIKAPRESAPDFVKGSISIKRAELVDWLNQKQDDWINLDIKVGSTPFPRTVIKRLINVNHSLQLVDAYADCESVQCS